MMTQRIPVLNVENLSVSYYNDESWQERVHQASFILNAGEMLAVVGESGSGKTTTAQSVLGLLPENGRLTGGKIFFQGEEISQWSSRRLDALRGSHISLIPQDPGNSLNPLKTIGTQIEEVLKLDGRRVSRQSLQQRAIALIARVGLGHPEQRYSQYPHQLSGGMKQRVLIALAMALQPALIIADEPTSALDVTVQQHIMALIDELRHEYGTAVLFVTHDLALAAAHADHIAVFQQGKLVEQGQTTTLINQPQIPYTAALIDNVADNYRIAEPLSRTTSDQAPALRLQGISKNFPLDRHQKLLALDNISLTIQRGSTHALVGESGSGKTTLARILLGFEQADAGTLEISGQLVDNYSREQWRRLRKKIQFVYQNPFSSLDPRQTLFAVIEEPLLNFEPLTREQRRDKVLAVTRQVALDPALLSRRAQHLSGGQRQRVAIARALIVEPEILVLDEATSALDVTVQAQILDLLHALQQRLSLTYLFITHDLQVVRRIAHQVTVLRGGKQVEEGETAQLFASPQSAYTKQLIAAIPPFKYLQEA